jgi:hypothetical protein
MQSSEARHEAVMQAEDRPERVKTRTPTAGQQDRIEVVGGWTERLATRPVEGSAAPPKLSSQEMRRSSAGRHE